MHLRRIQSHEKEMKGKRERQTEEKENEGLQLAEQRGAMRGSVTRRGEGEGGPDRT